MKHFFNNVKEKLSGGSSREKEKEYHGQGPSQQSQIYQGSSVERKKKSGGSVHPVLASEFQDDTTLTPPDSPTVSSASNRVQQSPFPSPPKQQTTTATLSLATKGSPPRSLSNHRSSPMSTHDAAIFDTIAQENIDIPTLQKLCWGGCPHEARLECWKLLCGYLPSQMESREDVLRRKRAEFHSYVASSYSPFDWDVLLSAGGGGAAAVGQEELAIMKQIKKDVPRMSSGYALLMCPRVQQVFERVLYIWSLRHPACGYVQGINDLILPFFYVVAAHRFCSSHRVPQLLSMKDEEMNKLLDVVDEDEWNEIEADVYWMSSRLLGDIQENYTFNQAGAHSMVAKLESVVRTVDPPLGRHLEEMGIAFAEFSFRWMNCLLMRELSPLQSLRLFDTYLSEEGPFSTLHVYVCAALLQRWGKHITTETDYPKLVHFLQNLPTFNLQLRDLDEVISKAFLMQQLYESAPNHLAKGGNRKM